jgi:hypothetical protein
VFAATVRIALDAVSATGQASAGRTVVAEFKQEVGKPATSVGLAIAGRFVPQHRLHEVALGLEFAVAIGTQGASAIVTGFSDIGPHSSAGFPIDRQLRARFIPALGAFKRRPCRRRGGNPIAVRVGGDLVNSRRGCSAAAELRALAARQTHGYFDLVKSPGVQRLAQRLRGSAEYVAVYYPGAAIPGCFVVRATGLILARYLRDLALPEVLVAELNTYHGAVA